MLWRRFFGVLQRFREISMAGHMLSNLSLEAKRLARAQAEACREAGHAMDWQFGIAICEDDGIWLGLCRLESWTMI